MRRKGRENSRLYKISKNIISYITSSFWEVFQRLFIVPKQTLMSFIYYKRVKKEKLQFWRKISKVDAHEVIFAQHAKVWHTLRKFGTPCQNSAHPAKFWHTLQNWCFCLAKCFVFLHFATNSFDNPFPSLPRGFEVLQSSDSSCAPNSPSILAYFSDPKSYQKH